MFFIYWSFTIPLTHSPNTPPDLVYNWQSLKFRENGQVLRPVQTCGRSDGFGTVRKYGEKDYHKRVRDSKKIT